MPHTYWIADPNGVKACVSDTAARDYWTHVQGWTETTEPAGLEFQWVRNENHGGRGVLNHEATLLHAGLGWTPSDPPPVDGMPAAPAPNTDGDAVKGVSA
jgi:hypothetical protein